MSNILALNHRRTAQDHAALLPPLLAEARHLAASVVMGAHGRRQVGTGEEFWQYRPAQTGDNWRAVDWRRSGRSDAHFIRQMEWQAAQSVMFWIDGAKSMQFSGEKSRATKAARASVLGLATAILLTRAGERVGLVDDNEPPKTGEAQIDRLTTKLAARDTQQDYGFPATNIAPKGSRVVFLSDFLGDLAVLRAAVGRAADRGVKGAIVQILDPVEESFPFDGRTSFESIAGTLRFETLRARGLKAGYLAKLAERKAALQEMAIRVGWQYDCHHTSQPAQPVLMWLYAALEKVR